jgi:hypothetical protein
MSVPGVDAVLAMGLRSGVDDGPGQKQKFLSHPANGSAWPEPAFSTSA